ncbi:hypothetical protein CU097_012582 [Rhizopus azygosporus]|uniref:Potassium channel tetramerisation-type BTB domain-containing protein n=1 Tax=Rhizopus azygosporus TaxID=86630 RepID=A0A367K7J4_RHIAZ|nr:hypothetical protein CU097_012582 [Rhizopus azygosporus]
MSNLGFLKFCTTPNYSKHSFLKSVVSKVPFADADSQQNWKSALKDTIVPSTVVQLDVGGYRYTTLYHTLIVSRYFEKVLKRVLERPEVWANADWLLVNRDGELFGYILDYLRTADASSLPSDPNILTRLKEEVRFYKIPLMESIIDEKIRILNSPQEEERERMYKIVYTEEYDRMKRTKGFKNNDGQLISDILLEYEEIATLSIQEPYWVCPRSIRVHTAPTKCGRMCKREFDPDHHGWHFIQVEKTVLATHDE